MSAPRIGDDPIEHQTGHTATAAELDADHGQRFAGVARIVGEGRSTHAVRFVFAPDTDHIGMLGHLMGGVKDDYRTSAGGDDHAIGEANPLALVLTKELIADSPVRRLVLAPVRMDLSSNFGG